MDIPNATDVSDSPACSPDLPYNSWKDTLATLHMWLQMVGKVQLALTPKVNHWWNTALHVSQLDCAQLPSLTAIACLRWISILTGTSF